jgi:hypothetical protein
MAPPSCARRHLEKDTLDRKVAMACLGRSARRPRMLVGEVAAWSSLSPSSEMKKGEIRGVHDYLLSLLTNEGIFRIVNLIPH